MTEAIENKYKQSERYGDDLPVGWSDEELNRMYRLEMVKYLQKGWKDNSDVKKGMLKYAIHEHEVNHTEEVVGDNHSELRKVTRCDVSSRVCGVLATTEPGLSKLRKETKSGWDVPS